MRNTLHRLSNKVKHWQIIAMFLALYDIFAVSAAYFLALWIRFDFVYSRIDRDCLQAYLAFLPIYVMVSLVIFYAFRLYNSIWRFASYYELIRILGASLITSAFHTIAITAFFHRMPASYYLFGAILQFGLLTAVRFSYRFILLERNLLRTSRANGGDGNDRRQKIMLIGAGAAGQMILRDIVKTNNAQMQVCCFIDDNSNKWGRDIDGVPIVGGSDDILFYAEKYHIDQILLAIPSASVEQKRDILNICKETGCELKSLPGVYQMVNGEVTLSSMKDVAVEDLLGRDPIKVNMDEIFSYIRGKRILVTGGGGSIGSELCRQIAGHNPQQLVIFDIYENNAYDIEQELKKRYPDLNLVTLIGSVRDSRRVQTVFETYRPQIVYHAAAHKHVPLMETSPNEAIKNNVIGTYKTAFAALKYGAERFVLISTDKAVNPTNIMGASKRLCEMVVQSMDWVGKHHREELLPILHAHRDDLHDPEGQAVPMVAEKMVEFGKKTTEFVAVRFGNVLGSNGSVIPLFKKQIAAGGPVTVTHPDIIRYFMTIPEAVSLVLQAGTYARGGEIFVLDMGDPVKIDTLARNLIKLSGHRPDEDIKIVYTGLRPGEKLFEEKLMAEEGLEKTPNQLIHIGKPIPFDIEKFFGQLGQLAEESYENSDHIVELVEQIVTTFHPAGEHPEERIGREKAETAELELAFASSGDGMKEGNAATSDAAQETAAEAAV